MRTRERSSDYRLQQFNLENCWLALAVTLFCFTASPTLAQDNEKCFDCHDDEELTGSFADEEMSMFVAEDAFATSIHSDMACVECHQDIDPKRRRHSTRKDLEFVDCGVCHETESVAHNDSLHGAAAADGDPFAPLCADCHGKHDILPASDPDSPTAVMNVPLLCGTCHQETIYLRFA